MTPWFRLDFLSLTTWVGFAEFNSVAMEQLRCIAMRCCFLTGSSSFQSVFPAVISVFVPRNCSTSLVSLTRVWL